MDFRHTRISVRRRLSSYGKVQSCVSWFLRGRYFQLSRIAECAYVNLGCGQNVRPDFLNIDYHWRPGVVCWDLTKGIPSRTGSVRGIFTEHCLEHFPLQEGYALLEEMYRVLTPGGRVRIVVPDGEMYLKTYLGMHSSRRFPYQEEDSFNGIYTRIMSVNRIFYVQRKDRYGHNFLYDFETLKVILEEVGFKNVDRMSFQSGIDRTLLVDTEERRVESLYVEACR